GCELIARNQHRGAPPCRGRRADARAVHPDHVTDGHGLEVSLNGRANRRRRPRPRVELTLVHEHAEVGHLFPVQDAHRVALDRVTRGWRRRMLDRVAPDWAGYATVAEQDGADERLAAGPQRRVRGRLMAGP